MGSSLTHFAGEAEKVESWSFSELTGESSTSCGRRRVTEGFLFRFLEAGVGGARSIG